MKIRIYSDLHLETGSFTPTDRDHDLVILAGDIATGTSGVSWALDTFPECPVLYVPGNHEYYDAHAADVPGRLRRAAAGTTVTVLERSSWIYAGIRFLGCTLWTDLALMGDPRQTGLLVQERLLDYRQIRVGSRRLRAADVVEWHTDALAWLNRLLEEPFAGPTVVITHHAPSAESLSSRNQLDARAAAYASALDEFVAASGADLWIHGHVHHPSDYYIEATRVLCNPRGHEGNAVADFSPTLTVSVGEPSAHGDHSTEEFGPDQGIPDTRCRAATRARNKAWPSR
jgi:predicted phosphodiesterase